MQTSRTTETCVALLSSLALLAGFVFYRMGAWSSSKAIPLAISRSDGQKQSLERDRPKARSVETRTFTLKDSDAAIVANELTELFTADIQYTNPDLTQGEANASELYSVTFTVDTWENTLTATGPRDQLQMVDALVRRLDGSNLKLVERRRAVIRLHAERATEFEKSITRFISRSMSKELEKEIIVVADPTNNIVLMTTSPHYFKEFHSDMLVRDWDAGRQSNASGE